MNVRTPHIINYYPTTTFRTLHYHEEYGNINDNEIQFQYKTKDHIHSDIFRKHIRKMKPIQHNILEMYEMYTKTITRLQKDKESYNSKIFLFLESTREYLRNIQECVYNKCIELWLYHSLCSSTPLLQPHTERQCTFPSIVFPRVYQVKVIHSSPYVDMETMIDMIFYTPYLYVKHHKSILNQCNHLYLYHDNQTRIPFTDELISSNQCFRPNMYLNQHDNIGWRQMYNAKKKKFYTYFITRTTYDLFIENMRETIHLFHKNNMVYLDWNMRNIGYSELDKRFKLFDFDACCIIKDNKFIQQPKCKRFMNDYIKQKKQYPETLSLTNRRYKMSPYEIDWMLFYIMIQEIIVV